jgi:hypothetical protein
MPEFIKPVDHFLVRTSEIDVVYFQSATLIQGVGC